jgi:hypothetical protein
MPLIEGEPKLWNWRRAIGWIGFDLAEPPHDFNLFYQPIRARIADRLSRRDLAIRALDQLLDAISSRGIEPIWLDDGREDQRPSLSSNSRDRMVGLLDAKLILEDEFSALHFYREAILQHWPSRTAEVGTIAAETECQKWLAQLASSGELQEPRLGIGTIPSKSYWREEAKTKIRGLNKRAFDRAWAQVAKGHPDMSEPGRKKSPH